MRFQLIVAMALLLLAALLPGRADALGACYPPASCDSASRPNAAAYISDALWAQMSQGTNYQAFCTDFMSPTWLGAASSPAFPQTWTQANIGSPVASNCSLVTGRFVANAGLLDGTGVICRLDENNGFASTPFNISSNLILSTRFKLLGTLDSQYVAIGWGSNVGGGTYDATDNRLEAANAIFLEVAVGGTYRVQVWGPDVAGSPTVTSAAITSPAINIYTSVSIHIYAPSNTASDQVVTVRQDGELVATLTHSSNRLVNYVGATQFDPFILAHNEGATLSGPALDTLCLASDRPPDN